MGILHLYSKIIFYSSCVPPKLHLGSSFAKIPHLWKFPLIDSSIKKQYVSFHIPLMLFHVTQRHIDHF